MIIHEEGCEGDVCTCEHKMDDLVLRKPKKTLSQESADYIKKIKGKKLAESMQEKGGVTLREYLEIKGEYVKQKGNTRT